MRQIMRKHLWVVLISLALCAVGCTRLGSGASDSQVQSDVQNKINKDNAVPEKQLTVASDKGVVTLSGTVSSEAARVSAASDAAQVDGVKTVVNNLEVAPASASTQPPQQPGQPASGGNPEPASPPVRPRESKASSSRRSRESSGGNGSSASMPSSDAGNANNSSPQTAQQNAPPPPPPTPTPIQTVTVPSGTQLSIRMIDPVDSEKAQVGDVFHGSISAPVTVGDSTAIPTTADVEGKVVDVKSAGRFAGQSVLTLQLTKLTMDGKSYAIQTDQWSKSGNGRGKATAAKVGGGAAVGAILGGILGGGKGAAIGAAAGAGAGTGVSAVGKGKQILLTPESVISFQLQSPVTVTPGASRKAMQ